MNIKQNYISADKKTGISSFGEYFTVGEIVAHQDDTAGQATIIGFEIHTEYNEVLVETDKGSTHVDFLVKL